MMKRKPTSKRKKTEEKSDIKEETEIKKEVKEELGIEEVKEAEKGEKPLSESLTEEAKLAESPVEIADKKTEITETEPIKDIDKDLDIIQNQQIKWAVFLMASIVLIIVLVPYIKINFIDKFEYKGLVFQKTKLGEITFYSSKFPIVQGITGRVLGEYAVNLRNDPRKLEYIPVNTTNRKINFATDVGGYGPVYISLNPFMKTCEDTGIALLTLSGFLRDSGLKVNSAVTDIAYAKANNLTQRWCHNDRFDTVIIYTDGNETSINEINENCYEVKFNNCEVMQATEKLMLTILEEYTSQFKK